MFQFGSILPWNHNDIGLKFNLDDGYQSFELIAKDDSIII